MKKGIMNGTKKHYIGNNDGQKIYLSPPSWDCDWYWGFGYLGNKDCHYHLDGLSKTENLHDAIINHFTNLQIDSSRLWEFCELVSTAYKLRECAEVLGRGGSNYSNNPCKDIIIDKAKTREINEKILPEIFEKIEAIFNN